MGHPRMPTACTSRSYTSRERWATLRSHEPANLEPVCLRDEQSGCRGTIPMTSQQLDAGGQVPHQPVFDGPLRDDIGCGKFALFSCLANPARHRRAPSLRSGFRRAAQTPRKRLNFASFRITGLWRMGQAIGWVARHRSQPTSRARKTREKWGTRALFRRQIPPSAEMGKPTLAKSARMGQSRTHFLTLSWLERRVLTTSIASSPTASAYPSYRYRTPSSTRPSPSSNTASTCRGRDVSRQRC